METRLDNFGLAPAEIGAVERQIADLKVRQQLTLVLFHTETTKKSYVLKNHLNVHNFLNNFYLECHKVHCMNAFLSLNDPLLLGNVIQYMMLLLGILFLIVLCFMILIIVF